MNVVLVAAPRLNYKVTHLSQPRPLNIHLKCKLRECHSKRNNHLTHPCSPTEAFWVQVGKDKQAEVPRERPGEVVVGRRHDRVEETV